MRCGHLRLPYITLTPNAYVSKQIVVASTIVRAGACCPKVCVAAPQYWVVGVCGTVPKVLGGVARELDAVSGTVVKV